MTSLPISGLAREEPSPGHTRFFHPAGHFSRLLKHILVSEMRCSFKLIEKIILRRLEEWPNLKWWCGSVADMTNATMHLNTVWHLKSEHFFANMWTVSAFLWQLCQLAAWALALLQCGSVFSELAVCAQCAVCVFSVVAPCQCGFSMFTVQCGATNVVCSVLAACLQCGTSGTSVFSVWHRASVFAVWYHASVFSVWHHASVGGLGSRDLSSPVTIIDSWQITSNNPPWSSSPATCWCWRWPSGWFTCCNSLR